MPVRVSGLVSSKNPTPEPLNPYSSNKEGIVKATLGSWQAALAMVTFTV